MHWTYQSIEEDDRNLQQGDILLPTENKLKGIFEKVHPHFIDPKYNGFLILTQSCDLFRRSGNCKSKYINLAVIRPLEDVLTILLNNVCRKVEINGQIIEGVYLKKSQEKARMLLERIFNQNEQAQGIFYLHPDIDVGIAVPSIAMLQVSIALRAEEHYDILVESRKGRLSSEFQSKLGWLIGNLFSRVATRDWLSKEQNQMINDFLLPNQSENKKPCWIPQENIKEAKKSGVDLSGLDMTETLKILEQCKPKPSKEIAIEQIISTVKEEITDVSDETLNNIEQKLRTNVRFETSLK